MFVYKRMVLLLFNMIDSPPPPPQPYISSSLPLPLFPKHTHAQSSKVGACAESKISLLFASFAFVKSPSNVLRVKAKL